MIELIHIDKSFEGRQVLFDVNTVFQSGKNNLIIGASGGGKSVLMKCMVGLEQPEKGQILFDGRDLMILEDQSLRDVRREIGMLFQGTALFDSLTVEENIAFPLQMFSKMTAEERRDRVNFCLKRVNLENVNKKYPDEISGGMKKRVGIARAIVNKPNYLFCDEPNSGLDPQTAVRIDDLILEITQEFNTTTVVVTHDMNSVMGIGENILFIFKGQKLWEGSKDTIMNSGVSELDDFVFSNKIMRSLRH